MEVKTVPSELEIVLSYVTIDPKVQHGNPCVRGTRLPITDVLDMMIEGWSMEAIAKEYEVDPLDTRLSLRFASALLHGDVWRKVYPAALAVLD
jgi:uncharacterized protein (DUF433 family)